MTVFPPTEKLKDLGLQAPKPVQHPLHPVPAPHPHHTVPSLISSHGIFSLPGSSAATALLIQRTNEEEKWLARQRRLRQEKEDRQSQVSEFRQQVLEQHLDLGRAPVPTEAEHRPESARWVLGGASREASDAGASICPSVCPPFPSLLVHTACCIFCTAPALSLCVDWSTGAPHPLCSTLRRAVTARTLGASPRPSTPAQL